MQESFGGILNLVIIIVFFLIVEGVLGFIVVYTKAFKMKNVVISAYEKYEAIKCDEKDSACKESIKVGASTLGYNPPGNLACAGDTVSYNDSKSIKLDADEDGYFCVATLYTRSEGGKQYAAYRIVTQVDMDFPIVKNILGLSMFTVTGDTREIRLNR